MQKVIVYEVNNYIPTISVEDKNKLSFSTSLKKLSKQNKLEKNITTEEKIGKGAFGEVFRAKILNHVVAIKKISHVEDSTITEFEIHTNLSHCSVLSVYHHYQDQTSSPFHIIMEYCESDLEKYLSFNNSSMFNYDDENQKKAWIYLLLQGLHFMHSNKVIHRDLKPGLLFILLIYICVVRDLMSL
jgi:serine/threonine protein kinase